MRLLFAFLLCLSCATRDLPREEIVTSEEGYVLIVPMGRTDQNVNEPRTISLIDKKGNPVKEWEVNFVPMLAKLDQQGNIYISGEDKPLPDEDKVAHGIYRYFEKRNRKGDKVWSYRHEYKHHDFELLPNGNIAFLQYYPKDPKDLGIKTKGMRFFNGKAWPDRIVEIDPSTNTAVWTWNSHEEIDFSKFKFPNRRGDLLHTNSIDYIEKYYLTGKPAYMISARSNSSVFIIDKETGKILWKSPTKLFYHQHDATFVGDNKILVFSNGRAASEVIEYDLKKEKVSWRYSGGEHVYQQMQFYSSIISGAQRLPNGNTLITLGNSGYLVEVNRAGEAVWNYFNTLNPTSKKVGWPYKAIFKARQYDKY